MSLAIRGIGTAVPDHSISQEHALEYAGVLSCRSDRERRVLRALHRRSGVRRRGSVLLESYKGGAPRQSFFAPPADEADAGPTTADRMRRYEREATPLASQAAARALDRAGCAIDSISHLITVSCSGFFAPGVDIALIRRLGLRSTVQRTHVGFMGCHGALNGLRVAGAFAASDPAARVLVCAIELCSLHYHYGWNADRMVANAIFSDGAAAVVGEAARADDETAWVIRAHGSCLIPDSENDMTWRIRDHGFEMGLSPRVPKLIEGHLRPWLKDWLAGRELRLGDVGSWAVHPGGPRILDAVRRALGLKEEALETSRAVLREHGNMSSPTILFVLDRLRSQGASRPCVALGFGPGLVAEAALIL